MHRSIFTYHPTRPYPYPWFTWVVVMGGIAATALISVVGVAANGYNTSLVTVSNPNETEDPSRPSWFRKQPWSIASKISPKCQDQVINAGSMLFTSTFVYRHMLQNVFQVIGGARRNRRSLAYHHSTFEDCQLARVTVAAWPTGYNLSFVSTCAVYDNFSPVWIELWTYLDNAELSAILNEDKNRPSWFNWYNDLSWAEAYTIFDQISRLSNGTAWTARADYYFSKPTSLSECRVLLSASSTYDDTTIRASIGEPIDLHSEPREWPKDSLANLSNVTCSEWSGSFGLDALSLFNTFEEGGNSYLQPWNVSSPAVSLFLRADNLVRTFSSGLVSELGQTPSTNIFANSRTLFDYIDAVETMNQRMDNVSLVQILGPLIWDYSSFPLFEFNETSRRNVSSLYSWANLSAPSVQPSFINTLYLYQIPKMKPVISLVFAVIVTDLVFLQTIWVVLNFVVKSFLDRRDDTANYCAGCVNSVQSNCFFGNDNGSAYSNTRDESRLYENRVRRRLVPNSTGDNAIEAVRRRSTGEVPRLPSDILDESTILLSDTQMRLSHNERFLSQEESPRQTT